MAVSPGLVGTAFVQTFDQAWIDRYLAGTPLRRVIQPAEVADAVVAVATTLRATTGAIIPVDAGRSLP